MTAKIIFEDGKWIGMANDRRVVKSYDQTRVVKMMAKAGYRNVPIQGDDVTQVEEKSQDTRWDINLRFKFVSDLVSMVAKRTAISLIVTGPGGLGKTHTVKTTLEMLGFRDVSGIEADSPERSFKMIKGYSTAKGLYRELFQNRDSIIVFDDCDSVLKDPVALNLLKGALDSYDRRIISWNADIRDEDLPRSFLFNGRVIFISNIRREDLDLALKTRAYVVDLAMTFDQKIQRMQAMAESEDFMPEFSIQHKQEALALIKNCGRAVTDVSLRTLQAVTRIRASAGRDWQSLAEYAITN